MRNTYLNSFYLRVSENVNGVLNTIMGFNHQQWVIVFLVVLLMGFYCMRGFGSRVNY